MADFEKIVFRLEAENSKLKKSLNESKRELTKFEKSGVRSFNRFGTAAKRSLAGIAVGAALGKTLGFVVSTAKEFEKLRASLETVEGSVTKAESSFRKIKDFASTTPFELGEVTEAFIRLRALGLDPSAEALTSYGNTASAMSRSLNQVIEAVADAATGEFERLKDFGIKAKSQGDEVEFIFRGVSTTVKKNAQDIERYLQNIGNVEFAGGMERQMDTLSGATSNLGDALSQLADQVATDSGLTEGLKDLAHWITEVINSAIDGPEKIKALREELEKLDNVNRQGGRNRNAAGGGRRFQVVKDLEEQLIKLGDAQGVRTAIEKLDAEIESLDNEISDKIERAGTTRRTGPRRGIGNQNALTNEISRDNQKLEELKEEREDLFNKLADLELEIPSPVKQDDKTPETLEKTKKALEDMTGPMSDYIKLTEEGAKVTKEFRTPVEKASDEINEYFELLNHGKITQETYNRAVVESIEDMNAAVDDGLVEAENRAKDFADDFAASMTSAFEDAVFEAESAHDIINGILEDIGRSLLRNLITGPLTTGISGFAQEYSKSLFKYSEGTDSHPGGLAVVGDGGESEVVGLPNGSYVEVGKKEEVVNLPKGSTVTPISHIPKYADGIPKYALGSYSSDRMPKSGSNINLENKVTIDVQNNAQVNVEAQKEKAPDGSALIRLFINEAARDVNSNGTLGKAIQGSYGARQKAVKR